MRPSTPPLTGDTLTPEVRKLPHGTEEVLSATRIAKIYGQGDAAVQALDDVSFGANVGEFVVVVGRSGSGKSTLLHVLGGLDEPTSGDVRFKGESIIGRGDKFLSRYRRVHVGFVFQAFHVLPTLTAVENVALPLLLEGVRMREALERSEQLLSDFGLRDKVRSRPGELSGGQIQRIAVARAIIGRAELVLADEPTGNLDTANGIAVLTLLKQYQEQYAGAVVLATHDDKALAFATRVVEMSDGRIVRNESMTPRE